MTASQQALMALALVLSAVLLAGSGVWLTLGGRPYGGLLQTAHKLSAIAACALFVGIALSISHALTLGLRESVALAALGALAATSFVSGGVIGARENTAGWLRAVHGLSGWLGLAVGGAIAFIPLLLMLIPMK